MRAMGISRKKFRVGNRKSRTFLEDTEDLELPEEDIVLVVHGSSQSR